MEQKQVGFKDYHIELINSLMSKRKCTFAEAVRWMLDVYGMFFIGSRGSTITYKKVIELEDKVELLVKIMKKKLK